MAKWADLGVPVLDDVAQPPSQAYVDCFPELVAAARKLPELWRDSFLQVREVPGRGLCGVQRFIFTCGLLTDLSFDGVSYSYSARYCYPIAKDARQALCEWDGTGDPPGEWIKEMVSERTR